VAKSVYLATNYGTQIETVTSSLLVYIPPANGSLLAAPAPNYVALIDTFPFRLPRASTLDNMHVYMF